MAPQVKPHRKIGFDEKTHKGGKMETKIVLFRGRDIRKTLHNNEWWFVVEDVVLALIDSKDPKQYIQRLKQRDPELGKGWVQIVHYLLLIAVM